ncbi:hypothetical protein BJ912DRAFT_1048319 [Pholiota molesta]|nr:hypothetical protein BJ912DRAFT_1048319 [Pholiota molesta]
MAPSDPPPASSNTPQTSKSTPQSASYCVPCMACSWTVTDYWSRSGGGFDDGGNDTLRAPFFRAMTRAAAVGGSIYVVSDADGSDSDILSVGMWFGPGQKARTHMKEGWMEFYGALTPQAREWWEVVYQSTHEDKVDALLGSKRMSETASRLLLRQSTDMVHHFGEGESMNRTTYRPWTIDPNFAFYLRNNIIIHPITARHLYIEKK